MNLDLRTNLLSVILIAGIAILLAVGLLSFWLLGGVDSGRIEPSGSARAVIDAPVAESPSLADIGDYSAIIERPVFFADRRLPVMEVAGDADADAESAPEPAAATEIPPLEAKVAGIIITPETKLAMVSIRGSDDSQLLREGMALAGDRSAWKVTEIRERAVRFETDGGRSQDLELEVETSALKTGARPAARTAAQTDPQQAPDQDAETEEPGDAQAEARARAEEIRRRVAERRAQLRAEAERRARENNDG